MSRWVSTRGGEATDLAGVVARSLAADGGLFVPEQLEPFSDLEDLLALDFHQRSVRVLARLLGDGELAAELSRLVPKVFNFPLPLTPLGNGIHALELFHGPTLAFKDFGARFLAAMLALGEGEGTRRTVLTATSGDTGSAVAHAFFGQPGVSVVILYPAGRVSPLQEKQFASLGGNVRCFAVDGTFDDCQALAKACFTDRQLVSRWGLLSANSIHALRWIAQVPYYFEAVARLPEAARRRVVIAVPSGNFGNLAAGLLAERLGLAGVQFIAATNNNTTVPEFLAGAPYRPRPSVPTLSNAMDVGAPSNWERVRWLFGDDEGRLRAHLRGAAIDEATTESAMRELAALGFVSDPHGAVGYAALVRCLQPGETGIFLATAHAAKFRECVESVLGQTVVLPPALAALTDRPVLSVPLERNFEALKRTVFPASLDSVESFGL